jgi:CubicO group peptidase (beta-lactamase class C family)
MNRRRFLKSSALVSAVLPTFAVRAAEPGATKAPELSPSLAELEQLLPKLMAETHVPGCSIAVVKEGTLHWRRAFGVKDRATM